MGHTPGPWYANQDCIEIDGPEGPRDVTLAVVLQPDNADADARLIAAAPELLEVVRAMGAYLIDTKKDFIDYVGADAAFFSDVIDAVDGLMDLIFSAIAKAEGRADADSKD